MARNRSRQNQQTTQNPSIPKNDTPADTTVRTSDVKPADQEKLKKLSIPKNNTREEVKRDPETIVAEAPKDETVNSVDLSDRRQLGVDEAIAYAMTTPEPRATINRLTQQRKLKEVTLTKQKLEELGH